MPKLKHPDEVCRLQKFQKVQFQLRHSEEFRQLEHRVKQLWTQRYGDSHLLRKGRQTCS